MIVVTVVTRGKKMKELGIPTYHDSSTGQGETMKHKMRPVAQTKPNIICLSSDDADKFDWQSNGWNALGESRGTPKAKKLMKMAHEAIKAADTVPDAIRRLEEAGFTVTRQLKTPEEIKSLQQISAIVSAIADNMEKSRN